MNTKDKAWRDHIGPRPGTRHRRHCFDAGWDAATTELGAENRRLRLVLNETINSLAEDWEVVKRELGIV
jgi:hypothetical protein